MTFWMKSTLLLMNSNILADQRAEAVEGYGEALTVWNAEFITRFFSVANFADAGSEGDDLICCDDEDDAGVALQVTADGFSEDANAPAKKRRIPIFSGKSG